jgi:6-phosphofructokinase 1
VRIGILTGGGDAPGLNAAIRAVARRAFQLGHQVSGVKNGWAGCLEEGLIDELTPADVRGILPMGGTILGTSRTNPAKEKDGIERVIKALRHHGVDALVPIGGDDTLGVAAKLHEAGFITVGVPKTIDNDLERTAMTFGFDSAVSFATECLDRLHSTAAAHHRIMVAEVMGRYAGWIALHAGMAGNAHAILIPEIPFELGKVAEHIRRREKRGRLYSVVVVAEGATAKGGKVSTLGKRVGQSERLGGMGIKVGQELEKLVGRETRVVVLGHLLRGGTPTSFDRLVALRFGAAAVRALESGHSSVMVSLEPPHVRYQPLEALVGRMKRVSLASDTIATARDLGISFGD